MNWSGQLGVNTPWRATDTPLRGDIAELLTNQWDINKMVSYLPVYDATFAPHRDKPVTLTEIGVGFGGSLELWRKYFTHPDTVIIGIDNNPKCKQFDNPDNNVHIRIGDQQDVDFLQTVIDEFGQSDIIIDDGSHIPSYTLRSFQYLFPNGLADGGAYLVEDLHTCYSTDCREPFDDPAANDGTPQFVDIIKQLIDTIHHIYTQTPTGDDFSDSFEPGNPDRRTKFTVPLAAKLVSSIEIHDSIAVIRRGPRELPRMIRRWSRDRMTSVINEDAALFLTEHPHLDRADTLRRDWINSCD